MEQDGFYKVIVIGDYNTGKSAILNRLVYNKFTESYTVTVGVEYGSKEIEVDGEQVQLQIWDSVGSADAGRAGQVPLAGPGVLRGRRGRLPHVLDRQPRIV